MPGATARSAAEFDYGVAVVGHAMTDCSDEEISHLDVDTPRNADGIVTTKEIVDLPRGGPSNRRFT